MRLVKGMILDCCLRKSFNARTPPVGAVNAAAPVALGCFGMRHACVVLAEPQERRVAGAPELKGGFWHSRSNRRRASSSETLSSGGGRLSQEFLPHGLSVARGRR